MSGYKACRGKTGVPGRGLSPLAGVLLLAVPVLAGAAGPAGGDAFPLERYRVLSERNIYLRERTAKPEPVRERPILREADPPVYRVRLKLAGIAGGEENYQAFLEDLDTSRTSRVSTGDALFGGRVEKVAADHVLYTRDGLDRVVRLGGNLEITSPEPLQPAGSSSGPARVETETTAGGNALLEQLRRRRQSELEGR